MASLVFWKVFLQTCPNRVCSNAEPSWKANIPENTLPKGLWTEINCKEFQISSNYQSGSDILWDFWKARKSTYRQHWRTFFFFFFFGQMVYMAVAGRIEYQYRKSNPHHILFWIHRFERYIKKKKQNKKQKVPQFVFVRGEVFDLEALLLSRRTGWVGACGCEVAGFRARTFKIS